MHASADSSLSSDSQLPVRILDTNQSKWKHGSEPFHFPPNVTRFRLEFVCFVGDKTSENLDVDISAILFDAKVGRMGRGRKWGRGQGESIIYPFKVIKMEREIFFYRLPVTTGTG